MNACPLPIDWLDLLEGRSSSAAYAHLSTCASCAQVVEAIRRAPASPNAGEAPQPPMRTSPTGLNTSDQTREADHTGSASIDDIAWLENDDTAVPALVLDIEEVDGVEMANIIPLWVDVDASARGDLLLNAEDTTLARPWRAIFRHQSHVPIDSLRSNLGRLTPAGQALVRAAIAGNVPLDRSGPALESPYDPRLANNAWIASVIWQATQDTTAYATDEDAIPPTRSASTPATSADDPIVGVQGWAAELERFLADATAQRLDLDVTIQHRSIQADYALAASTGAKSPVFYVESNSDPGVRGRLWLDGKNDRLMLNAEGLPQHAARLFVLIYLKEGDEPIVAESVLAPDETVLLAEHKGVSERDVERLEIYVK